MTKVGLLVLAEGHQREDVYKSRRAAEVRETNVLLDALKDQVEVVLPEGSDDVRGKRELIKAVKRFEGMDLDAVLIFVSTFISASLAAMAVRILNIPCAILGNNARDSYSQVGYLAALGAIEQAGLTVRRVTGDIREEAVRKELMNFFTAAHVKKQLLGQTYGMFGGRSLGISTGSADTAQWLQVFGVDIEQIDQFQIVKEAVNIPAEEVGNCREWIASKYGKLDFKEGKFDGSSLERMIRSYLAVKKIAEDSELDFLGIKCQPDMSNGYVLQCLTVQLLNDPYDADGAKDPMVCSCEADCDGAMTMQILKLLSEGRPTALQDIFFYDKENIVFANCGSSASWFAAKSSDPDENLKEVYLIPHGFGVAGGAATQFCFAPGEYTYARLFRKGREYVMAYAKGEVQQITREDLDNYVWYRPTAVVKGIDTDAFAREFDCNHMHCVAGDYTEQLKAFCELQGIPMICLSRKEG